METDNSTASTMPNKNRRPEFWRVIIGVCQGAILIDLSLFFLFYFLESYILAWVNVVSVIIYTIAYYSVKNRKTKLASFLIWTEVIVHATLGILLIGWDSGFHYYLLLFIPAICLTTTRKSAYIALTLLFGLYVGLHFLTWSIDPFQPINSIALKIVHMFNLCTVFVSFSYLSFYYLHVVRRAQKNLHVMATTDPLTKLFNRSHMTYLAEREIQRSNRTKRAIGVLLIDIDYFKEINDQYGHKAGDDVIISVGVIVKNQIRTQDLVARWGGEEFLIILPDTNTGDAQLSAERIRTAFHTFDWLEKIGLDIAPTISVGVSELSTSESLSSAIARADHALYKGKEGGRNRVEFAAI